MINKPGAAAIVSEDADFLIASTRFFAEAGFAVAPLLQVVTPMNIPARGKHPLTIVDLEGRAIPEGASLAAGAEVSFVRAGARTAQTSHCATHNWLFAQQLLRSGVTDTSLWHECAVQQNPAGTARFADDLVAATFDAGLCSADDRAELRAAFHALLHSAGEFRAHAAGAAPAGQLDVSVGYAVSEEALCIVVACATLSAAELSGGITVSAQTPEAVQLPEASIEAAENMQRALRVLATRMDEHIPGSTGATHMFVRRRLTA